MERHRYYHLECRKSALFEQAVHLTELCLLVAWDRIFIF